MKKKYGLILISAVSATVLLFSCSKAETEVLNETPSSEDPTVDPQTELVTITAYLPEEDLSKVSITESDEHNTAILAWEASDQITIVSTGTEVTTTFGISEISGDGKKATFTGVAPAGTAPYTIFHHRSKPLTLDKFNSISYDGQLQDGNGSTDHLQYGMKLSGVNEYQSLTFTQEWATANSESGTGTLTQNSVLQLLLKLPDGVANVYSIYVHDDGSFKQTLWLKDGANLYASPTAGHIIKAYMMVPEMTLADGNLTVRVETEDGAYEGSYVLAKTDWTGGSQYTVKKNMSGLSAVTGEHAAMEIHAKCAQDIIQFADGTKGSIARFKNAKVILENNINMNNSWSQIGLFNGTFDGNDKTFSNLISTGPMFESGTGTSSASIKNFTLDNTCAFTFTQGTNTALQAGSIITQLRGTITGVTVNAAIRVGAVTTNKLIELGGLVGRLGTGSTATSISNCHFGGSISVPSDYQTSSYAMIGGLVGNSYNASNEINGNSSFSGTISFAGKMVNAEFDTPADLAIGGIAGKNVGTITSCATTDNPTVEAYTGEYGAIVNKSTQAVDSAVGGIVGINAAGASVTSSSNASSVYVYVKGGAAAEKPSALVYAGGIAGYNAGTLSTATSSSNTAAIISRSNAATQKIGGIVGYNEAGTISGSFSNSGAITVDDAGESPNGARTLSVGGIIGHNTSDISSQSLQNNAGGIITIKKIEASTSADVSVGGIIGLNSGAIDGGAENVITNQGKIHFNTSIASESTNGYNIGGVIGCSTKSVSYVKNQGYVHCAWASNSSKYIRLGGIIGSLSGTGTLDHCTNVGGTSNAGEVFLDVTASQSYHCDNCYVGGILGHTTSDATISNCSNSGYVHGGNSSGANSHPLFVGGIVGYLASNSSISSCTMSGTVYNNQKNNSTGVSGSKMSVFGGGIAGYVIGNDDTHRISITNCSVSNNNIGNRRGYSGGIVGYSKYTNIGGPGDDSCTVGVNFEGSSYFVGGLAGAIEESTIYNCTMSGTSIVVSQLTYGGGLVAQLLTGGSLTNCYSYVTMVKGTEAVNTPFKQGGALVGLSKTGTIIHSCHYPVSGTIASKNGAETYTWSVCGDTNWEDTEGSGDNDNTLP